MKTRNKKLKAETTPTLPIYRYTALKENVVVESIGVCETYGIVCTYLTPEGKNECTMIHDVTTDKNEAMQLAKRLTKANVPTCHFQDAVEDALV